MIAKQVNVADLLPSPAPTGVDDADLFAEAIRGFLLSKHLPFSELDAWADEITAIAIEHSSLAYPSCRVDS